MWARLAILLLLFGISGTTVRAADFIFPMDCTLGKTCFLTNSPDFDRRAGAIQDSECGKQSTDGAMGIDIALPNIMALKNNAQVGAAADGTIYAITDNAPDQIRPYGVKTPVGVNACGNGVIIDHKGGWRSLYCHLRQGSLLVKKGDHVLTGQVIGQVGLSGATRWPKLTFSLLRNGGMVDPITGSTWLRGCGQPPRTVVTKLNAALLQPVIAAHGVSANSISDDMVRAGTARADGRILKQTREITLWLLALGVRKNDVIKIKLIDPNKTILSDSNVTVNADGDALPVIANITNTKKYFVPGVYKIELVLKREDKKPYATAASSSFMVE